MEKKTYPHNPENRRVRPAHPGEVIADVLEELGVTQTQLANHIGVSRRSINQIINGSRSITVDMAYRLAQAIGGTHRTWLNLQQQVDAWDAIHTNKREYAKIKPIKAA